MRRTEDETKRTGKEQPDSIFSADERWYFRTSAGEEIGPFRFRSEAESSLDRFLAQLKSRVD